MRNLIAMLLVLATVSFAQTHIVVASDTVGNSDTITGYLDLDQFAPMTIDSVVFSIYAYGEIDLDSIAVYQGMKYPNVEIKDGTYTSVSDYDEITSLTGTLTVNLAASAGDIVEDAVSVAGATIRGNNSLKVVVLSGSAGNDGSDTGQMVLVVASVYTTQ